MVNLTVRLSFSTVSNVVTTVSDRRPAVILSAVLTWITFGVLVNLVYGLCWMFLLRICDALRDLVPFVQFEKREKHPRRSVNFSKVSASACNVTKINTLPWVFFTFFKLHKSYQIAQRITYVKLLTHFMPLVSFYALWKHQNISGFLMFFGGYRKRPVAWNGLNLLRTLFPSFKNQFVWRKRWS